MPTKKFWIIVSACALALLLAAGVMLLVWVAGNQLDNRYTLSVALSGDQEFYLEYGQSYSEPGATAQFFGTHRHTQAAEVPVSVEGSVNTQTRGTYLLKYIANYAGYIGTGYRRVHVVDSQAPVITLVSDPEKFTFPNETYAEEGFSAVDNCDGDITNLVHREETREKVTYTVTDSAGNTTTVERQIVYNDPIPPGLTLKGKKTLTIIAGQDYKEPGYTASDNCDGDLTGKVSVTGSVDRYTPGNYTLIYTVMDSYKNMTSASRTITVKPSENFEMPPPTVVVPNGKVIYLTFDDGPGKETPVLLDILKKYNVKATFFVVNTKYISTIKRAADEGHTIAIHSATHKFKEIYSSEDAYFNDLYRMQEIIKGLTGVESKLVRFPGGSSNTTSRFNPGIMTRLARAVSEKGFRYFDWNVDSKDAGGAKTADDVFDNVVNGIGDKKISVVLQHDIKGYSIEAVERIIQWGLSNGYTFLPLEHSSPVCQHNIKN